MLYYGEVFAWRRNGLGPAGGDFAMLEEYSW